MDTMNPPPAPADVRFSHRLPIRRHRPIRRIAIVGVFGAAMFLASCSSGGSSTTNSTQSGQSGGGPGGSAHAITIKNFAFSPNSITVTPGATVTVTNGDSVAHTVTSKTGAFDTGDIQAGQSKTFTAPNKAGSYPYICTIHQYMAGTLTVS
jgi:plastocyanin